MTQDHPEGVDDTLSSANDSGETPETDSPTDMPIESAADDASAEDSPADDSPAEEPAAADVVEEAPASPAPAPSAAAAAASGGPEVSDTPQEEVVAWYVLRVQSGREDSIANNLRKKLALTKMDHLVEDVVVPKQNVTAIKEGKKRTRKEKLFPGYIFVHARLEDDLWYLVRDTSGIGDFIGSGRPIPMGEAEVRKVLDIMEEKEEAPQVKIDLMANDTVKIVEGPFENFDGVVEEVNPGKGIVRVMVTIFGRSTPVDLEYWQVEKL